MGVDKTRIAIAFIAWVPFTALLFRFAGPRLASLIAVVVGYAFLPGMIGSALSTSWPLELQYHRYDAIGAGLVLGILCVDRQALRQARLLGPDLLMLAYALFPLTGIFTGGPVAYRDVADMLFHRCLGWLAPYAAGRLYFADGDGARRIAVAIVAAGLALVPVCTFEMVMGPRWYVMNLVYGIPTHMQVADRLGGWRPAGFFHTGLEMSNWLALSALTALWLWLGRAWRPRWGPSWGPTLVLILTSVASRGVFGYLALGIGLIVVVLTQAFRTRWVLVALVLTAPIYMALRLSGLLGGEPLIELAGHTHRPSSFIARIKAEEGIIQGVFSHNAVVGIGTRLWNPDAQVKPTGHWPDGLWLLFLWEGGLVGLILHVTAVHLVPVGLALTHPRGRPDRVSAGSPAWGLALFSALHLTDILYNTSWITVTPFIGGALVGQGIARRASAHRRAAGPIRDERRAGGESTVPKGVPLVAALACLLYVFGHGPVAGHESWKLVGGLGAALLFGLAGWAGAWAAGKFPLKRVAAYGLLFAALGTSFNLFIHPTTRPFWSADILQGLALCGIVVTCWRRGFGDSVWADSALAIGSLVVHFLLRPALPVFPGSQYLFAGTAGGASLSLFPVFPWLTLAVLGARAARESATVNLATASCFAIVAAFLWWDDPGRGAPVKFPMNLSYALLSCAAVGAAFALAEVLSRIEPVRLAARWLGARWLVFFYLHFAVVMGLSQLRGLSPLVVWSLLAAGSIVATWLASAALAPLKPWFRHPAPWVVVLGVVVAAGWLPGLKPPVVAGLAGAAGLVFAAHYGALASCIASVRWSRLARFPQETKREPDARPRPWPEEDREPAADNHIGRNLIRLGVVLVVLAAPEILRWVVGPVREGRPANHAGRGTSEPIPQR